MGIMVCAFALQKANRFVRQMVWPLFVLVRNTVGMGKWLPEASVMTDLSPKRRQERDASYCTRVFPLVLLT